MLDGAQQVNYEWEDRMSSEKARDYFEFTANFGMTEHEGAWGPHEN